MSDRMSDLFANHIAMERAIDAAWRRMRGSTAPKIALTEFVDGVMAKCPHADRAHVAYELNRRMMAYRPRRKKRRKD